MRESLDAITPGRPCDPVPASHAVEEDTSTARLLRSAAPAYRLQMEYGSTSHTVPPSIRTASRHRDWRRRPTAEWPYQEFPETSCAPKPPNRRRTAERYGSAVAPKPGLLIYLALARRNCQNVEQSLTQWRRTSCRVSRMTVTTESFSGSDGHDLIKQVMPDHPVAAKTSFVGGSRYFHDNSVAAYQRISNDITSNRFIRISKK